jgi:hypothetical protein
MTRKAKVVSAQGNGMVKRPIKQPAALKGSKLRSKGVSPKKLSNKVNLKKNSIG